MAFFQVSVDTYQGFEIRLKEEAFTPQFMEEFRKSFYPFYTLADHASHLGRLAARNMLDDFVEGYGDISEFAEIVELGSDIEVDCERLD